MTTSKERARELFSELTGGGIAAVWQIDILEAALDAAREEGMDQSEVSIKTENFYRADERRKVGEELEAAVKGSPAAVIIMNRETILAIVREHCGGGNE